MSAIEDRFSAAALQTLRAAIRDAGGNEVLLLGTVDDANRVETVRVLARGNRNAVAALLQIARPGEVLIHNHPSSALQPSEADVA
ncbi:MAG TPA: JAB domain-containing protein, partial [Terriglobales bacterium]|nr:JAB domain-containing protein [Terriglobales bacterium]